MREKALKVIPMAIILTIFAMVVLVAALWWGNRENLEFEARLRKIPDATFSREMETTDFGERMISYSIQFEDGTQFQAVVDDIGPVTSMDEEYNADGIHFRYSLNRIPLGTVFFAEGSISTLERNVVLIHFQDPATPPLSDEELLEKAHRIYATLSAQD